MAQTEPVSGHPPGDGSGGVIAVLKRFIEAKVTQRFIIGVILFNAVVLGLETSPTVFDRFGPILIALDVAALSIFVVEIAIKLIVYRWQFFRSGWNVFDFVIVAIALVPTVEWLSVMRALRILRAFRLLSVMPQMRQVVTALLGAIPAMGSVILLLTLVFYVSAVMATKLFGADYPDWFGSVGASLFSLFQIMTLESWSMGIVRPVMDEFPYAWVFFVPFILMTSFIVLNLFIAIIVNAMHQSDMEEHNAHEDAVARELAAIRAELVELRREKAGEKTE
ncbi:ion transporter [Bauldia sp.]|uniref:ion transporter n=1 Tax=Bauldia sp. TaxID=2575872 RepID=UPI003BA8B383